MLFYTPDNEVNGDFLVCKVSIKYDKYRSLTVVVYSRTVCVYLFFIIQTLLLLIPKQVYVYGQLGYGSFLSVWNLL